MRRRVAVSFSVAALLVGAGAAQAAGAVRQLTDSLTTVAGPGALDDAGTTVFAGSTADFAGENPSHAMQIVRFDPASAAATPVTAFEGGTTPLVSVSDDGLWLAFPSPGDLTGGNHDESSELFVMRADGTGLAQLTDDPAPNAGSVTLVAISGDASRVAFVSTSDPLGANPDGRPQLFVIGRDGSGLAQLTSATAGSFGAISISDDGDRLVFSHDGDLAGSNADLGSEVYAILTDGTGLVQVTSTAAGYESDSPALSGNGAKIAFQSDGDLTGGNTVHQVEVFVVNWGGAGLRQLTATNGVLGLTGDPASQAPVITDDGVTVVFYSNHSRIFPPVNIDGNFEIFRIRTDGTALTALTSSLLDGGSLLPSLAGGGGRITFYEIGSSIRLRAMDGAGNAEIDLLSFDLVLDGDAAPSPDGTRVAFVRTTGLFDPSQVWMVQSDGAGLAQVTSLGSGNAASPSIGVDPETVVFSAGSNPAGANGDLSEEIFAIGVDGTGIAQLTSGPSGTASRNPIAASGTEIVVFDSDADLLGSNADGSREVFAVRTDGTGLVQLTDGPAGTTSAFPRPDATGTWVAFESNADFDGGNPDGSIEIYRVAGAGGPPERVHGEAAVDARRPDISADGATVVFDVAADPVGANPEGNGEIFAWDAVTGSLRQLTFQAEGASAGARIAGDRVWFSSDSPVFEDDPDRPSDLYRVPLAGGAIERVGALRAGFAGGLGPLDLLGGSSVLAPSTTGHDGVFSGIGDVTGGNPDLLAEVWRIDRNESPRLEVGKESPTVLSWVPESGPIRYDVVRGDVAGLAPGAGEVDLGTVVCLEDDSPDADTRGFGDLDDPSPGQTFFFLYRGSQGMLDGPGSYGTASDDRGRIASAGDCSSN